MKFQAVGQAVFSTTVGSFFRLLYTPIKPSLTAVSSKGPLLAFCNDTRVGIGQSSPPCLFTSRLALGCEGEPHPARPDWPTLAWVDQPCMPQFASSHKWEQASCLCGSRGWLEGAESNGHPLRGNQSTPSQGLAVRAAAALHLAGRTVPSGTCAH